jgi:hypothetical protein
MTEIAEAVRKGLSHWSDLDEPERTLEQLAKDIAHYLEPIQTEIGRLRAEVERKEASVWEMASRNAELRAANERMKGFLSNPAKASIQGVRALRTNEGLKPNQASTGESNSA